MNVLLETAFNRLLSRYERTFGEQPPFTRATAEEVIAYMRRRLAEHERSHDFPCAAGFPQGAQDYAGGASASLQG
ncbi:MAG: hypothetical protein R3229_07600 [Alphaproteobacteria bacterium]|nr:hypothetical protein [Alphaproteobacteria bacterium]